MCPTTVFPCHFKVIGFAVLLGMASVVLGEEEHVAVSIGLHTLTVHDEDDWTDADEPYLVVIGFRDKDFNDDIPPTTWIAAAAGKTTWGARMTIGLRKGVAGTSTNFHRTLIT